MVSRGKCVVRCVVSYGKWKGRARVMVLVVGTFGTFGTFGTYGTEQAHGMMGDASSDEKSCSIIALLHRHQSPLPTVWATATTGLWHVRVGSYGSYGVQGPGGRKGGKGGW